jgi:hypothetical protein
MEYRARGLMAEPAPGFQAGGALRETSLYIDRRADLDLLEGLERGELCAVVAPRQMGKSSLRRRAELWLSRRGVRCLSVDLGLIGSAGATDAAWFCALCFHIAERAGAGSHALAFFRTHDDLPPARRFARFVREELADPSGKATAVLIDELDVALGLPFCPDDFFAEVSALCGALPGTSASTRLAFGLFGVTAPARWMRDPKRSPPLSRVIVLEAFTREQTAAFLPGLAAAGGDAEALLDAVVEQTRGHPYLTQRICELLVQRGAKDLGSPSDRVARIVEDELLEEDALRAIRRR